MYCCEAGVQLVPTLVVKTFSKAAADKLKKSSDYFEAILVSSTIYCHFFYFIFLFSETLKNYGRMFGTDISAALELDRVPS